MTFIQARGPVMESTAIATSAFSKGDLLMYDSNSSLSRLQVPEVTAGLIAGVALASSLESIGNEQVPYALALANTVWYAQTVTGSQFTPGERLDVDFTSANFLVGTSTNSTQVVIMPPGDGAMVDSGLSRVLVRFDTDATIWDT